MHKVNSRVIRKSDFNACGCTDSTMQSALLPADGNRKHPRRNRHGNLCPIKVIPEMRINQKGTHTGHCLPDSHNPCGKEIDRRAAPWMAPAGIPFLVSTPDLHTGCCTLPQHIVPGMLVLACQKITQYQRLRPDTVRESQNMQNIPHSSAVSV